MSTQSEIVIKIATDSWNINLKRTAKLLESLTDEQLQQEVAPGRNTGVYLLGHLVAVHDGLLPLYNLGEKLYPELEKIFISSPDKSNLEKPSVTVLRQYWKDLHDTLANHFTKMNAEEWLQKHASISEEDFAKEPHRNKLNVLLNRTNHLSYHFGQLAFLK